MLEEIFHEGFWKFPKYEDLYGKPCKRGWMAKVVFLIQMLPTFGGRYNRYFWDIRLKTLRVPNFNMLFQLVLNCFRVYRKLIAWSSHAKSLFNLSWAICKQFKPKKAPTKAYSIPRVQISPGNLTVLGLIKGSHIKPLKIGVYFTHRNGG